MKVSPTWSEIREPGVRSSHRNDRDEIDSFIMDSHIYGSSRMREICLTDDLFSIHEQFDEEVAARGRLCSQFGIMSHVFGSRSTICQYKGVTRGSLHTNSGAEQLVILNIRNPLETYGPPLPFLPSPCPSLLSPLRPCGPIVSPFPPSYLTPDGTWI